MFGSLALSLLLAQVPALPTLDLGQLVATAAADNPQNTGRETSLGSR